MPGFVTVAASALTGLLLTVAAAAAAAEPAEAEAARDRGAAPRGRL